MLAHACSQTLKTVSATSTALPRAVNRASCSKSARSTSKLSCSSLSQASLRFHHETRLVSSAGISSPSFGCRWYARPKSQVNSGASGPVKPAKKAPGKKKPLAVTSDGDEILESEADLYPDLEQPYNEKDVPEDAKKPMKQIKLPKQKVIFNYKTYRYKDLQADDPDRVTASWTVPAAYGEQARPGESKEPILHTKDSPGEDLSKDAIQVAGGTPLGLDGPIVPYVSQMTTAIYDILLQEKAEDIVIINIDGKTNWLPTMVIVTAISPRHCVALANRVAAELKRSKLCRTPKIERNVGDEWVIVATGTTILEIMTAENREYMDLERLWVLKKSAQETFEFDEDEERFMYDEEDGMWDDDDPDY